MTRSTETRYRPVRNEKGKILGTRIDEIAVYEHNHCAHVATYLRHLNKLRHSAKRLDRIMAVQELCGGEPVVERRNLMSGQLYLEPYDTPAYCSPARESYWSM